MAGNPFRRPGAVPSTLATGREGAGELSIDTSDTTVKPKKVVKKVRIQSPIISPDDPPDDPFGARLNEQQPDGQGHPGSPQPPQDPEPDIATQLRRSFIDSVAKGASNLNREAVGQLPPQSSGMGLGLGLGTEAAASRVAQQQAPLNPFSRTLASIEGGYGSAVPTPTVDQPKSIETPTGSEQAGQGAKATGKPAMDVDSFTRMLMTGTPAPAPAPVPAPAPASAAPPRQALSTPPVSIEGTSTETSSLSKQSMFDQVHDLHPESPRSSYDSFRSEDAADHNEHSSLVGGTRERKAKPPPPAHHRGKLLSSKGPQTVSFADFDASSDPTSEPESSASPIQDSSRSKLGRSPSDLNKPLPLPPSTASPSLSPTLAEKSPIISPAPLSSTQGGDETQSRKARPPPPPTSRRTSQMRVDHPTGRARSSSQLSKSSVPDDLDDDRMVFPSTSKPPPPPSRRVAGSIPSADRENNVVGVPRSVPDTTPHVPTGKAPPPPPSRQTLRGTPTIARTPSTASISSTSNRRVSPSLGQGQVPPPPPPRRGDKRSSLDGINIGPISRRASNSSQRSSVELHRSRGASFNHGRAPSISSLQHVPESEASQDTLQAEQDKGKDILADLSAFQAEIDALRAQIEG